MNQIRVPVGEIDDLLDLAAWYASSRVTVLVNENGGWRNFKNIISTGMESSKLTQLDQSITMSQFERTIQVNPDQLTHQLRPENVQEVEMGSMVVLEDQGLHESTTSTVTGSTTEETEPRMNSTMVTTTHTEVEVQSEPEPISDEIQSNEEISNERSSRSVVRHVTHSPTHIYIDIT